MKNILITILTFVMAVSLNTQAQEFSQKLGEAQNSYTSGDLENARFALQQSLQLINQEIGKEILKILPDELGGLPKSAADDNVSGMTTGFAGLFVHREYVKDSTETSVELISDSPLMAGINAMLSMPVFMTGDPNQKKIKVKNYKALLSKSVDDNKVVSFTVNLPFSSSMLTLNSRGINDEKKITAMLESLPLEKIVALAQ